MGEVSLRGQFLKLRQEEEENFQRTKLGKVQSIQICDEEGAPANGITQRNRQPLLDERAEAPRINYHQNYG